MGSDDCKFSDLEQALQKISSEPNMPKVLTTVGMPYLSGSWRMFAVLDGAQLPPSCLALIAHSLHSILKNKSLCRVDVTYTTQAGPPNTTTIAIFYEPRRIHGRSGQT